jgi:hypothetical protein
MKKYPRKKVITLFSLAPIIGSFLFYLIYFSLGTEEYNLNLMNLIYFFEILFKLVLGAELVFFIPAFIFSLIYVKLKLTRIFSSFIKIIFIGYGVFLIVWLPFFLDDYYRSNYESAIKGLGFIAFLASCSVFSSLIMAWFALPKPEDLEEDE